jgi:hypothetical protein
MKVVIVGLLVLIGVLSRPSLRVEGSPAALANPDARLPVAQQPVIPPVSTIPPLATIPPLSPTPTAIRPTPPAPSLAPTRAAPAVPTPIPPRPTATVPVSSQSAPRAGGFPTEVALLLLVGSVTALGGGLYMLARSRR